MFVVTDKRNAKKSGLIWDSEKNVPLIKFKDGKATTEDSEIATKLTTLGFTVKEVKNKD